MAFGDNLTWKPLYWIYHDQWHFRTYTPAPYIGWVTHTYKHRGHVHFFFPGFDPRSPNARAYGGSQNYVFKLEDEWSPRTDDPNQSKNIKIVGKPKWYFYVEEFWRRIYVQLWDYPNNENDDKVLGKRGIKWDASQDMHTYGPFRETKDNYFYWTHMARTLPVEYFRDVDLTIRDHVLRQEPGSPWNGAWSYDPDGFEYVADDGAGGTTPWVIPRTIYAGRPDNRATGGDGPAEDNRARSFGFADSKYIYPTIEYQRVLHLDYERLPYSNERDLDEDNFGDGFEITISIPFKDSKSGAIQSPFSNDDGVVSPPGSYHHNFEYKHPEQVLKHAPYSVVKPESVYEVVATDGNPRVEWDHTEWDVPNPSGVMEFSVPANMEEDGYWVEQCLGAIVRARALVTIEDNFGGRSEVWVTGSQYNVQDGFSGVDQNEPEPDS